MDNVGKEAVEITRLKKEVENIEIWSKESIDDDRLREGWLPELGIEPNDMVYIKRVGNHIEIGKAEVNCIE